MSSSTPKDNQDWENFRFPTKPVLPFEEDEGDDDGRADEDGGDEDGGGPELRLRRGFWEYRPETASICSVSLGKLIPLRDIDQAQKIIRLLTLLEERTDYDIDSLIDALEAAAMDCYGQDLGQVLADHRWGIKMEWKPLISLENNQDDPDSKSSLNSRHSMG